MNRTSEGRGIRCVACGSHFPLATIAAAVACPFCGARQDLRSHTVEQVRQYREDVFGEMRKADSERQAAAAWGQWSGAGGAHKTTLYLVLAVMIVPTCLSIPAYLLHFVADSLPPEVMTGVTTAFGLLAPLVVMGAIALVVIRQARRSSAAGATTRAPGLNVVKKVACPHCGAPNHLAPGQALQNCAHCRGALMPSRTIMVEGLDLAKQARRQASLARYRAERRGWLGVQSYMGSYQKIMPIFYLVSFAPMLLGLLFVPFMLLAELELRVALLIGGVIVLGLAAVLALLAYFALRWWRRRQAFGAAVEDLATQFHGRVSTELEDFVGWLDAYWAGPYETRFLNGKGGFRAVTLDAWGYPAVLTLRLRNASPMGEAGAAPRFCRLLIGAWVPSRSEGGPPPPLDARARQTMQWLSDAGFDVSCEEAGILARARPPLLGALMAEPAALHSLAPVIGHVARLAREVGATPVTPMR